MKQETINKLVLSISIIFGFYFAFVGIWNQNKLVAVPAFIFLIMLTLLGLMKNVKKDKIK